MSQPNREEVEAFIAALNFGMKVSHKPEFLIALAEGWLENENPGFERKDDFLWTVPGRECAHEWDIYRGVGTPEISTCRHCGASKERP